MNFVPAFRNDVVSIAPNGKLTPINPRYCLTDESAKQLAEILADLHPTITQRQPFGGPYGAFVMDAMVPWLRFQLATADEEYCFVNAGLVAQNWLDQSNPAVAERYARQDVVNAIAYYLQLAQGGW